MLLKFALFISAVALCSAKTIAGPNYNKPEVVCYWGTWSSYRSGPAAYNTTMIDPFSCTTIIYSFFGITEEGTVRFTDPWLDLPDGGGKDTIRKFNALKHENPELITLAAVGGYNEGSKNFSIVAASDKLRKKFAKSVLDFVRYYNFSGCDIDWEYPMRRNDLNNNDTKNFNLFLKEIRLAFAPYKLNLTVAVSATKPVASEIYDVKGLAEQVDRIHIMAYDLALGTDPVVGFNAPLYPPQNTTNELNVDAILKYWTSVAPSRKLILGVPFYGHNFQLKNASQHQPGAPSAGPGPAGPYSQEAGTITYNELCLQWKTQNWTKVFDKVQKVPYAYLNTTWVSYDDAKSIILKGNLAIKYNLAGVMAWSLESDDLTGACGLGKIPLLKALNEGVFRVIPSYDIYDDLNDPFYDELYDEAYPDHPEDLQLEEAVGIIDRIYNSLASIYSTYF